MDPRRAATPPPPLPPPPDPSRGSTRRVKRNARKRMKRKKCRQRIAEEERLREEARLNDPEEQLRMRQEIEIQAQREEFERKIHEEEERRWLERERRAQEEFRRKEQERMSKRMDVDEEGQEQEEDGEYEDGPAEIIWVGNEITIKKTRVKTGTKLAKPDLKPKEENEARPTRNPSPPPRLALSQRHFDDGIDQAAKNYGTEQDKTHCPFHIKTGACRFGPRCSRIHVYPEKSCTILIKNMYTGPGLAWEHDEGLESAFLSSLYLEAFSSFIKLAASWRGMFDELQRKMKLAEYFTDEEVEEQFEEFYDDVHSEFLKFGELVNFKVCRNSSPHLRGNVYIQYQDEEAAIAACCALSGRFYATKQMIPEFVGVTKWKVALCGEYMKSHQTCSRGSACNFLHCFRNPGGEYEWADRDGPPPRSWRQKMASLFGQQLQECESKSKRDDRRSHQRRDKDHYSDHRHSRSRERDVDDDRSYRERRHRKRDERDWHGSDGERKRSRSSRSDRSRGNVEVDDGGRWLDSFG